jgi:hypothetical protein
MELKNFVAESITQITEGILDAQNRLKDQWVRVNPKPHANATAVSPMLYTAENGAAVFPLAFDVAVSAEEIKGGGSFGIKVLNFGANIKTDSQQSSSRVSRVAFTIPIAYPLKNISGKDVDK